MNAWWDRLRRGRLSARPALAPAPPLVLGAALFRSLPGRLLLFTTALLVLLLLLQQLVTFPPVLDLFRKVVRLSWFGAVAWLLGLAILRNRRAFLWRVRRKLILSYVFLGVVPVVLIVAFVMAGSVLLYVAVASYVFSEGYNDLVQDVREIAEASALEIGRDPAAMQAMLERRRANRSHLYPGLSLAVVPAPRLRADGSMGPPVISTIVGVGPWGHAEPPALAPAWVVRAGGFAGTIPGAAGGADVAPPLIIRAASPLPGGGRMVIVDLPMDEAVISRLHDRTGTRIAAVSTLGCGAAGTGALVPEGRARTLFRQTVAFLGCTDWTDESRGDVSVRLDAPVGNIYERIASANSSQLTFGDNWTVFLLLLQLLGALFLIIQGSALVMGGVLARSITSAVHELFVGTERVQQGDFTHRIAIGSRDQLGELAESFNRMSASIEHLLHVQREKQRLDDELRIAREIQKSLLPVHVPRMPGLDVADLCEPAREVGGDYYDFFEVGPRQLGVLIADVSGKGTSAALYMAELKGLLLALSHTAPSPRQLLIDVNRRLADHLDNRSFITMTYAVIDLDRGTLTSARAGHTPLIVVSDGESEIVSSDGMVLGLRLPGAGTRFEEILEEHCRPIAAGDVIVLYTDGVTEAMDSAGELFGDTALARVVAGGSELGAAAIRERVLREVKSFVGDAEPHDDMTMVIVKVTGVEAAA